MNMTRRNFFVLLAGAAGAGTGLLIYRADSGKKEIILVLNRIVPDVEIAQTMGKEFLRQFPKERDFEWLTDQILPTKIWEHVEPKEILKKLRSNIHNDFKNDRTVYLHHWLLSRTEARIFGLITLASQRGPHNR